MHSVIGALSKPLLKGVNLIAESEYKMFQLKHYINQITWFLKRPVTISCIEYVCIGGYKEAAVIASITVDKLPKVLNVDFTSEKDEADENELIRALILNHKFEIAERSASSFAANKTMEELEKVNCVGPYLKSVHFENRHGVGGKNKTVSDKISVDERAGDLEDFMLTSLMLTKMKFKKCGFLNMKMKTGDYSIRHLFLRAKKREEKIIIELLEIGSMSVVNEKVFEVLDPENENRGRLMISGDTLSVITKPIMG